MVLLYVLSFVEVKDIFINIVLLFDIIFLDFLLLDKIGIFFIEEVMEIGLNMVVIVLIGYLDLSFGVKLFLFGVFDYILKDEFIVLLFYKSIVYSIECKRIVWVFEILEKCVR